MMKNKIPQFNLSPTITVDQAVLYMLSLLYDYRRYLGLFDDEFCLQDHLYEQWDETSRTHHDALLEIERLKSVVDVTDEELEIAEQTYENTRMAFDNLMSLLARAKDYRQQISLEVSKARRGKSTWIIIDEVETARAGQIHISRDSFIEWFEGLEMDKESPVIPDSPLSMHEGPHEKPINRTAAKSLHITLGLLVELFAETDAKNLKRGQKPNVKGIAEQMVDHAKVLSNSKKVTGQDQKSIENRLKVALYALEADLKSGG